LKYKAENTINGIESDFFRFYKQTVSSGVTKFQNEVQYLKSELLKAKEDTKQIKDDFTFSITDLISKLPEFTMSHDKG